MDSSNIKTDQVNNKIAIFHCEASLEIGTGHVMRCITLANNLKDKGWQCNFATSKTSLELISQLKHFPCFNPEEFFHSPKQCDLMVFDNYQIDINYEKHFRPFAKKILVIDDLANRKHDCDVLIDQNLGTTIDDYKGLVNANCKILAGTKYCILRKEFAALREKAIRKRQNTTEIKNILVNFGGSDVKNYTLKALQEIEDSQFSGTINVVLGFNAVHFDSVQKFATKSKNHIMIHNQADMATLIYEADLAFAAGGTSTWERCCLALPTYLVKIADNQEKVFSILGKKETFNEFYKNISKNYKHHANTLFEYTDGLGSKRILSKINSLF